MFHHDTTCHNKKEMPFFESLVLSLILCVCVKFRACGGGRQKVEPKVLHWASKKSQKLLKMHLPGIDQMMMARDYCLNLIALREM